MNSFPPNFQNDKNNIAIDFDGVIHNFDKGYHDGTCYGEPIKGSIESIKKLSEKYKIIIFTAKAKSDRPLVNGKTGKQLVSEWLDKYGILEFVHEITSEKPRAFLYVDDNGFRFVNWGNTMKFINESF
jgi:hypothetical protein